MDYKNPNYTRVMADRAEKLALLRSNPKFLAACKIHYANAPWDFISDWGVTFEPRNVEKGLITNIPFVLWQRQIDYLKWMYEKWQNGERGLVEKSRDCGVTWLSVGFAASMWLFRDGFVTGFGSRKEDLVDKRGDSKSIFEKVRFFVDNIPKDFLPPSFNWRTCSAHCKLINPDSGAEIIGEVGDEIGRGGRASIYIVDEAAFLDRQEKVDAALSQNTNCQIDISTPNGNGNAFYKKRQRFNNTNKIFVFDWRDDPRKDQAWYQKQCDEQDEVTVAQEINRDYNASSEDAFIPAPWVQAAIDAHKTLGFSATGMRCTSFDPADVGDAKAIVNRHGSILMEADQLMKGDITKAVPWAFEKADQFRADVLCYDADGMGAPTMKTALVGMAMKRMQVKEYHGSSGVKYPDASYSGDRTNKDTFVNYRSQTWTDLRDRFKATYDAIDRASKGMVINIDPDELISINSRCSCLHELTAELSRPKRVWNRNGKIGVESKKDMRKRGVDSPNLADAAVIAFSVEKPVIRKVRRLKVESYVDPLGF